jgi:hypothetical protein
VTGQLRFSRSPFSASGVLVRPGDRSISHRAIETYVYSESLKDAFPVLL